MGTGRGAGISRGHVLGDEQLLPPGARLHAQVAVVDEQQLQEVLGQLGGPGHVPPRPQQLRERRGAVGAPCLPPPHPAPGPLLTPGAVALAGLCVGSQGAAAAGGSAVRMRMAVMPAAAMAA